MTLPLELGAVGDDYARRALENVAQAFPIGPANLLGGQPGTALPNPAVNGQDFYYTLSGGGVWHFKYNSTSGKWDFAGGPAMFNEVTTQTSTTSLTYADPAVGSGPALTLPFAGDYEVAIGANMFQTTGGAGFMSYNIGGTGAVDADSIAESSTATSIYGSRTRVKTGLTAVTLTAKYKTTANTLNIQDRWMRVIPVRIG